MKKEIVAFALLFIILAGNIWNLRRLKTLTDGVSFLVEEAFAFAENERWQQAGERAEKAARLWTDAGGYTHIFIRHTDIDALTAAFCDYRGALAGRDEGNILAAYLRLKTGLSSLLAMERLHAGSVF